MHSEQSSDQVLAYVHPKRFHFVSKDIEGLSRSHRVLEHAFISGSTFLLPWDFMRQFVFLIGARTKGVGHVVAHFAGYHTVLPLLLGFKTHIVIAGSDACSFPGIDYGSFRKSWMRRAMTYSMRNATTLLPVHSSLERFNNHYSDMGGTEQGYAHFVPGLRTPSIPIPYGFGLGSWKPADLPKKRGSAITVAFGAVNGNAAHYRKGLDLVITAARKMPDHAFSIVGVADVVSYSDVPSNLTIRGNVPPKELADLFATHEIVLQPSIMEGFPNALCEGMLCGCIPIVSNITSMPDIIKGVGVVLEHRDAEELIAALESVDAMSMTELDRMRSEARQRIIPFTMERRIAALEELFA